MNSHKNARLTPHGRALLVRRILEHGLRPAEAAQAMGVSVRTAYKWLKRFREQGEGGLMNRSSRPLRSPRALSPGLRRQIIERRHLRQTYRQIGQTLGVGHSTVARVLHRAGLNRLAALEPARPENRYEYQAPGDLLHLDTKKLGRFERPGHRVTGNRRQDSPGAGWEYVHVAIDDHSRVAFSTLQEEETGECACRALLQTLRYYASLGVRFRRVLTDDTPATSPHAFAACAGAWDSSTATPGPTARAPMARPSGSSRRHCESGPMPAPMRARINGAGICPPGFTSTIGIDPMPVWITDPRSAAWDLP